MDMGYLLLAAGIGAGRIARAAVAGVAADGTVEVLLGGADGERCACDVLEPFAGPAAPLTPGDPVLVWRSAEGGERGVVLGRIGRHRAEPVERPDELVLEAKKTLTLRCGDGSITIREDGKILIKGKDLVSHARRVNRIRGGSVAIN